MNWAKAHYNQDQEMKEIIMDRIRKEIEACEYFQGFQLVAGTGGGSGSGLTTSIIQKCREEYCDKIFQSNIIYPSQVNSEHSVEFYNAIFAEMWLIENSDFRILMNNEALYEACFKMRKIQQPNNNDFNEIVADSMIDFSSNLRMPNFDSFDLRKFVTGMKPFPRLGAFASTVSIKMHNERRDDFIKDLHDVQSLLCTLRPAKSNYLGSALIIRSPQKFGTGFTKKITDYRNSIDLKFAKFIDPHLYVAQNKQSPLNSDITTGLAVNNTTAIADSFLKVYVNNFREMFNSRKFVHKYTNEGVDEMEFTYVVLFYLNFNKDKL